MRFRRSQILVGCGIIVLTTGNLRAATPAADVGPATPVAEPRLPVMQPWLPPAPAADSEWDWIQLTSGEWLKGKLRSLEQEVLDFDSDNLGILELDWEDVQQVMSAKPMAILYGDGATAVGYLTTEKDQLVVLGTEVRIPLKDVISIAKGTPHEKDLWTGDIALTLNLRTGNVEQQELNSSAKLRRKAALSTFRFSYLGHYSYYDSLENANDHRATGTYDIRLNRDWFYRPVSVNYYRDPYQNIDHEWSLGSGMGLYVMDDSDITWIVTTGPGYQVTRYTETPADEDRTVDSVVLFLSTQYEQELSNDVDLEGSYQVIFSDEESGRAKHHTEITLEVDLTDKLDLMVAVYWDRTEKPQPDDEGIAPKPDDAQLAVGLNLEF